MNKEIYKIAQEGARNHGLLNISIKEFFNDIIIPKPPLQEQQKIADTFSSLDNLIEAHNKKLELLKQHKIGLMQKLFPKEGKKIPELRFKGFSGEWVVKKLEEVGEKKKKLDFKEVVRI